jgi:hypothetical protein
MTQIESTDGEPSAELLFEDNIQQDNAEVTYWARDKAALGLAAIIGLCAAGLLLLLAVPLLAVLQGLLGIDLPGVNALIKWLAGDSKGLIMAAGLTIVGVLSFLLLRYRLLHNPQLCSNAGCPQCSEHELIRVRRRRLDRIVAYVGIPVRRYVCRNCSWDGLRIGSEYAAAEREIPAPAADMLLVNDRYVQQNETAVVEHS